MLFKVNVHLNGTHAVTATAFSHDETHWVEVASKSAGYAVLFVSNAAAAEKLASVITEITQPCVKAANFSLGSYRDQMIDAGRGHLLRDTD